MTYDFFAFSGRTLRLAIYVSRFVSMSGTEVRAAHALIHLSYGVPVTHIHATAAEVGIEEILLHLAYATYSVETIEEIAAKMKRESFT